LSREVVYRFRDQAIGEVRRPLFVTRAFDVAVSPDLVVWPTSGAGSGPRRFTLSVTNRGRGPARAQVVVTSPAGWPRIAAESLSFQREDETRNLAVSLTLPGGVRPGAFRLGDYARAGGLVIVQYQQYPFVDGGFAPYRLSIARPHERVTDETAPVTPLDPKHPVFHVPNEIATGDWAGWVQERGLYFAHDW